MNILSGIILLISGMGQIFIAIYFIWLSKKRFLSVLKEEKKQGAAVEVNGALTVGGLDVKETIDSINTYAIEMNKTTKSVNLASGIIAFISGASSLIIGSLQLIMI